MAHCVFKETILISDRFAVPPNSWEVQYRTLNYAK